MVDSIITSSCDLFEVFHNKELLSYFFEVVEKCKSELASQELISKNYQKFIVNDSFELDNLYQEIYSEFRKEEDYSLFSLVLEKYINKISEEDFRALLTEYNDVSSKESKNANDILLNSGYFDADYGKYKYEIKKTQRIRGITNGHDYLTLSIISLSRIKDIHLFAKNMLYVFSNLRFDHEIEKGLNYLNDGFNLRRGEICYHLMCLEREIPVILRNGNTSYADIGRQLSLECSPERKRKTVQNELTCIVEEKKVNCELHTKMKRLSSKAADRIYFCPSLGESFSEHLKGRTYIYKITKHV